MNIARILFVYPFKVWRGIGRKVSNLHDNIIVKFLLKANDITFHSIAAKGVPYVSKALSGKCIIGDHFAINSRISAAPTANVLRSVLFINRDASLKIGNHVGMSGASLICHYSITIEDFVKIGAGAKIIDTDFHALDSEIRASDQDFRHKAKAPVLIKKNAFIGAFSIVLKGVTIGENSIVGAGSVVTKSVPDNEIWAGNPAKFIRKI